MRTLYMIMDGRAVDEDGYDDATCLDTADDLDEAREAAKDFGQCCIWAADSTPVGKNQDELTNLRLIEITEP